MNKIKERRRLGAICKACKSPDYTHKGKTEFGKNEFYCNSCGHHWQYGITDSIYTRLA